MGDRRGPSSLFRLPSSCFVPYYDPVLIPPRLLRAITDELPQARRFLTPRERAREELILAAGQAAMVQYGRHGISVGTLSTTIRIAPATFRRHFADLDRLLGEILSRHLRAITSALGAVPQTAPDRPAACRAAYLATTRTPMGGPTETHLLLIRDRFCLPPDERHQVEQIRDIIGDLIAGEDAEAALALLDTPYLSAARIEGALAGLAAARAEEQRPVPPRPSPEPPLPIKLRPMAERFRRPPDPPAPSEPWALPPGTAAAFRATAGP